MEKINLFGQTKSRGTFDDIYSTVKYNTLEEAYAANDYVECNYMIDSKNILFIEVFNVKNPEIKKVHRLNYQHCPAGIDVLDDSLACELARTLM